MKYEIKKLLPTQFAVGYDEVSRKIDKLSKFSNDELEEYIKSHRVPVIAKDDKYYLIDHHHLCLVLLNLNIEIVYIDIIDDYSDVDKFWHKMHKKGYLWPYDNTGKEVDLDDVDKRLPKSIQQLKDDPYRSLSGKLKKLKIYKKIEIPFVEFKWANFLRERCGVNDDLEKIILVAHSDEANELPGALKFKN